jgi:hypothetical protein
LRLLVPFATGNNGGCVVPGDMAAIILSGGDAAFAGMAEIG